MLKNFTVRIHLDGYYMMEDPHCPSYWKGSGCYDITINCWADFDIEVWAETEEQAEGLAYEYDYELNKYAVTVDAVQVESVKFVEDLEGHDPEEASVIEPVDFEWKEYEKD